MYNLVPTIGELSGLRSNYSFAVIPGEKREFGSCDFEIEGRKAEPAPKIRGDIARICFYMYAAYPGRGIIGKKNHQLFAVWDRQDPVGSMWKLDLNPETFQIGGESTRYFGNGGKYHA